MRLNVERLELGAAFWLPFISPAPQRVGLLIGSDETVDLELVPTLGGESHNDGLWLPAKAKPFDFNIREHGPLVTSGWRYSAGGGATILVCQWFLDVE